MIINLRYERSGNKTILSDLFKRGGTKMELINPLGPIADISITRLSAS